jgi:hypothetical protein
MEGDSEEGWVEVVKAEEAMEEGCGSASELESALKNASANKSVDATVVREAVLKLSKLEMSRGAAASAPAVAEGPSSNPVGASIGHHGLVQGKNASANWNEAGESQYDCPADFDELVARHENEPWVEVAMPDDAGIEYGALAADIAADNMAAHIAAVADSEEREPWAQRSSGEVKGHHTAAGRMTSRGTTEVEMTSRGTTEASTAETEAEPEPEPDYVHYAVTGPVVLEDSARSFVVQVWAMMVAKMDLFKDALKLSGTTEKRYVHTLDEVERAVTDFEVTVLVAGCCIVEPVTQRMHWNRKIKSVHHEVFIPQQLSDNQLDVTVIIRPIPSSPQRPILFKAPFKIFRRAESMQPLTSPYPHTNSSVLQGSDAILQRLNLVEQQLWIQREQNAMAASAIASASATAGRASCSAHDAAAVVQAVQRKLGVHPDFVEGVKRASVRIGLLDRAMCRLLELGSGTIIDAGAGAPRNQVLTVAHLFVDPVENLEPIWTKFGYPTAIDWTSDTAPLILAIGMWEADDQPSRWMWWAELVTPLATLQEKCQSPHAPHSMTHMLDLAVLRICGRLELTPDVFQGFGMDYSVVAKHPAMASLAGASSPLPAGVLLGDPDALKVNADLITVFGWFSRGARPPRATPIGSESNYTEGELVTALRNYEAFHRIPSGSATVEQLQSSSAKIGGWLRARPPPAAPAAHDAGIEYGVLAADIAADNMAAHIAAAADSELPSEVTLFAPQALALVAKSHGLLQVSAVLHSGGSGGAAVDYLGRLVAVSRRSDLPALPPKKCMGYLRMVSWLLPEHGLALSDRDETGVAYWNDGVMAWNEQHGLALSELPRAARDANGNAFDVRPTANGNAFDVRPTAVSAVPRKWPQPEWPPPPEGGTVWSEDEDTELRRRLAAFQADGWRQVDVVGDGNCFFRALAKQVNGDEQLHGRARQETIRYMREHREEFEHLVEDFDSYVDHMSREGTFVEGELEIWAAANAFNVCIQVFGRSRNHDKTFAPLERDSETRDVYMAHYQAAQHYVVLERMDPAPTARGGLPDPCRRTGAVSP